MSALRKQNRDIAKLPPRRQLLELEHRFSGGLFAGEAEREALKRMIYPKQPGQGLFADERLPEDDRETNDLQPVI